MNSKGALVAPQNIAYTFHSSYDIVSEKLEKWRSRFIGSVDESIVGDLLLFYLSATRKYLDHRDATHLFRLILSIHQMQKNLVQDFTSLPDQRHLSIRWIPTHLQFSFSRKAVLGCLIGFNVMDRYEMFDEENMVLALNKHLLELRIVKESSYYHTSPHKTSKILYFEVEKQDGSPFSLNEQKLLRENFEEKMRTSIQKVSPTIFMPSNEEELYKTTLRLSEEIQSLQDLPQAYITLDKQTGREVIFRVVLVHIRPAHRFSLKEHFPEKTFVSQRSLTVRHIKSHPIEAHFFFLHLPRDSSLIRTDGSLNFYVARLAAAELLKTAIGEFRDYNGGLMLKQQELLHSFKSAFPEEARRDSELLENFFYALAPIENQAILSLEILRPLFIHFLSHRKEKLPQDETYLLKIYPSDQVTFLIVHGEDTHLTEIISTLSSEYAFSTQDIAYSMIETKEGAFFNAAFLNNIKKEPFLKALQESLYAWQQKKRNRQILRVGFEYSIVSLDPRIGGDAQSGEILRLLFEGLTRFNQKGEVENAIAKSIIISSDGKEYIFKLRSSLWNDESPLTAHDFAYAWKKVLSKDFQTAFAYLFFPIKNAQEAKEGKVSPEEIGIHVLDDLTLKVELAHPAPYFLQLTAHTLYSPVHRFIDQKHPQWPYQCVQSYPCNGAFQLKVNHPDQGYHLIKNPFYWDYSQVKLDQIIFTKMNKSQALQAFRKKGLDWVGNPFGVWDNSYEKEERIISFSNPWIVWMVFNTSQPPFNNLKMRQALAYCIQRKKISEAVFLSTTPAYSVLPQRDHEQYPDMYPKHNLDKAKQFIDEALQELNIKKKDLPPIRFIYHEKGVLDVTAMALQQQFKSLGIECDLQPLPWTSCFSKITQGDFQLSLTHWFSWFDDPIYTLNAFKTKQEINLPKWENQNFQHQLDLANREVSPFQRSSYLIKAERILSEDMPIVPLYYQPVSCLVSKDLEISNKNPCGAFNIAKSFYNRKER